MLPEWKIHELSHPAEVAPLLSVGATVVIACIASNPVEKIEGVAKKMRVLCGNNIVAMIVEMTSEWSAFGAVAMAGYNGVPDSGYTTSRTP